MTKYIVGTTIVCTARYDITAKDAEEAAEYYADLVSAPVELETKCEFVTNVIEEK
jgi:hypothetical protein